jgi:hypothetical protein
MPHRAAVASTPIDQQAPCHREKPNKTRVFVPRTVTPPRQLMPLRQNFPPIDMPRALLEALGSALRAAVLALSAACTEQMKERFPGEKIRPKYRHLRLARYWRSPSGKCSRISRGPLE